MARLSKCVFPDSNWPGEYCFVRNPKKSCFKEESLTFVKCELLLLA